MGESRVREGISEMVRESRQQIESHRERRRNCYWEQQLYASHLSIRDGLHRMCTAGPPAGLRQLLRSFMRNLDDPPAMFAMDRIRIVPSQAAVGTFNVEPGRAKHQLDQSNEEGDPEDHDGNRQESS